MDRDVKTLRTVYEAINRGDVESIVRFQAADVVWRGAFADLTEPHRGHAGVRMYARRVNEAWGEFAVKPERFIDLGGRILVLAREQGRGRYSGAEVRSHQTAHVWTLRDGEVVGFQAYWDREEGIRAAGGEYQGGFAARTA
jgi:ketosteroid isomerase-like protein